MKIPRTSTSPSRHPHLDEIEFYHKNYPNIIGDEEVKLLMEFTKNLTNKRLYELIDDYKRLKNGTVGKYFWKDNKQITVVTLAIYYLEFCTVETLFNILGLKYSNRSQLTRMLGSIYINDKNYFFTHRKQGIPSRKEKMWEKRKSKYKLYRLLNGQEVK